MVSMARLKAPGIAETAGLAFGRFTVALSAASKLPELRRPQVMSTSAPLLSRVRLKAPGIAETAGLMLAKFSGDMPAASKLPELRRPQGRSGRRCI